MEALVCNQGLFPQMLFPVLTSFPQPCHPYGIVGMAFPLWQECFPFRCHLNVIFSTEKKQNTLKNSRLRVF